MGYTAGSFTTGQQPTTAQWNVLWNNDASFNDGTGIANLEIGSGHTSLKNDYKFSVYRSAAQSLTAGTTTKVAFDTKNFDTSTNFDATTNFRFTAPVAGFYQFSGVVQVNAAATKDYYVSIYKNGVELRRMNQQRTQGTAAVFSLPFAPDLISLAATDYIEIFVFNGDSGANGLVVGAANTYFGGFLVSQT